MSVSQRTSCFFGLHHHDWYCNDIVTCHDRLWDVFVHEGMPKTCFEVQVEVGSGYGLHEQVEVGSGYGLHEQVEVGSGYGLHEQVEVGSGYGLHEQVEVGSGYGQHEQVEVGSAYGLQWAERMTS